MSLSEIQPAYHAALKKFCESEDEGALFGLSDLSRQLVELRLGPEILMDIHRRALRDILMETDSSALAKTAMSANEALLNAMMTYAMSYHGLTETIENQKSALADANSELEAFSYSVSHDLRAPLRAIQGFSSALAEDYASKLDEGGRKLVGHVREGAERMSQLIDDLLNLSRIGRAELRKAGVNLSDIVTAIAQELQRSELERKAEFVIAPGVTVRGDAHLLRIALENLLSNSWKFTSRHPAARIEFGVIPQKEGRTFYIRDDGAGFDPQYVSRLFTPFQRLHSESQFPGTGIGLAIVRRVIQRHGGKIWAEGEIEKGATFYFKL